MGAIRNMQNICKEKPTNEIKNNGFDAEKAIIFKQDNDKRYW
jgi:hypothetical protein